MDANDATEHIAEAGEGVNEKFRAKAALWIGVLALLMAISGLGGGNAGEDMVANNIQASDTWAFFQAKNVRQTAHKLAADDLEMQLLIHGDTLNPAARKAVESKIAKLKAKVEEYESEPETGEGKKELLTKARAFEAAREHASEQDGNFDFADVFLQIAVVLGSVAILAISRPTLTLSFLCGGLVAILTFNGFFLWFKLPF